MKTNLQLTAVFEEAEEGGFIGFIEEIPGVNTQGDTMEETRENLLEAFHLMMDTQRMLSEESLTNKSFVKEILEFA